ncbi:MAG: T9SS type A sorting domain-containing protein, partial [candidate division KSB1 bacterium]|nr:T9SS type A sorting domain-containing protein [candidate division KSB1 bacterium]
ICQSNTRVDFTISPGFSSWAKSPESQFTIYLNGTTSPTIDKLGRYLFGASWNTQYRNPPTFLVDYPQPGQFKVATSSNTGSSPRIEIWLDGAKILSQPGQINQTYAIEVPAGQHKIFVDNQGTDWIEISTYVVTNYIAAIRSYSLVGDDQIIGWVQHRNYNWQYVKQVGIPAPVTDGKIQFSNLTQDGKYQFEWWLCSSGSIFSTDTTNVVNGNLTIEVPPIQWDYAYKISLEATKVETRSHRMPGQFKLEQNFPNPFNSDTVIQYSIPRAGEVELAIYNIEGKLVRNFSRLEKSPGRYSIAWDGKNNGGSSLASGVYFYQLKFDSILVDTKKMVLIK